MRLVGLLLALFGMMTAAVGFATVANERETWLMDGLGIVGIALVGLGVFIVVRNTRTAATRGFEVKLTPGTTPGLIEEKEDYHG